MKSLVKMMIFMEMISIKTVMVSMELMKMPMVSHQLPVVVQIVMTAMLRFIPMLPKYVMS